ncbi:MAG: pyridoxal phosphate-dependent aminotransferase [Candidatus Caldarchaeales archaeon]
MTLADGLDSVGTSRIEDLFELATRIEGAINLSVGEPDCDAPRSLVEAACRQIRAGRNKYGPVAGIRELRERIAGSYGERGIDVAPDNVFVTLGAQNAIFAAMASVLERGDEVVVFSPAFPTYAAVATMLGARVRFVRTSPSRRYVPELGAVRSAITGSTKVVVVNSPSNPTGAVYGRREMAEVIEAAREVGAYVLSDEVYEEFVYDGEFVSAAEFLDVHGRVLIANSFSKTLAVTGWRLGYLIAPSELTERIGKVLLYGHTCPPVFAQHAILEVLGSDEVKEFVRRNREEYRRRRDAAVRALTESGIEVAPPSGALYLFPRLPGPLDDNEFCLRLLEREKVVAVPGSTFGPGGEGHVRLSITKPLDVLVEGVRKFARLARALSGPGSP